MTAPPIRNSQSTKQPTIKKYRVSFGQIKLLEPYLAEVIIDEGIEMDLTKVGEYHDWIKDHLTPACLLLVNKINHYTFTFEAQQNIARLDNIKAIAIVSYSKLTTNNSRFIASIPKDPHWQLEIFNTRKEAMAWLAFCKDELCI